MEKQRPLFVPVETAFPAIRRRVEKFGDVNDIRNWRRAFPTSYFNDVDKELTGEPLHWDKRPLDDRYVNVALDKSLETSLRRAEVSYTLKVEGTAHLVEHEISDSERQWYLLFDGALRKRGNNISDEAQGDIPETAKKTLAYYATQNRRYDELDGPIDESDEYAKWDRFHLQTEYDAIQEGAEEPKRVTLRRLNILVPSSIIDTLEEVTN